MGAPAYLAVTDEGEIIGQAEQRGSSVWLRFEPDVLDLPAQFRLVPTAVVEGVRRAPALTSRTAHGLPAMARLKVGGHYRVVSYVRNVRETPLIILNAVYDEWLWKRLKRMAEGPINHYRVPEASLPAALGELQSLRQGEERGGPEMAPLFVLAFHPRL